MTNTEAGMDRGSIRWLMRRYFEEPARVPIDERYLQRQCDDNNAQYEEI